MVNDIVIPIEQVTTERQNQGLIKSTMTTTTTTTTTRSRHNDVLHVVVGDGVQKKVGCSRDIGRRLLSQQQRRINVPTPPPPPPLTNTTLNLLRMLNPKIKTTQVKKKKILSQTQSTLSSSKHPTTTNKMDNIQSSCSNRVTTNTTSGTFTATTTNNALHNNIMTNNNNNINPMKVVDIFGTLTTNSINNNNPFHTLTQKKVIVGTKRNLSHQESKKNMIVVVSKKHRPTTNTNNRCSSVPPILPPSLLLPPPPPPATTTTMASLSIPLPPPPPPKLSSSSSSLLLLTNNHNTNSFKDEKHTGRTSEIIIPNIRPTILSHIKQIQPRIVQRQSQQQQPTTKKTTIITNVHSELPIFLSHPSNNNNTSAPSELQESSIVTINKTKSSSSSSSSSSSISVGKNPYDNNIRNPNPASQWISRPTIKKNDATMMIDQTTTTTTKKKKMKKGGNFVRLNLRNKGGSCQQTNRKSGSNGSGGKYPKKKNAQSQQWWEQRKKDRMEHDQAMRLQEMEDRENHHLSSTGTTTTTTSTTTTTAWTSNTTLSLLPETMLVPSLQVDHHHHQQKGNATIASSFINTTNGTDVIDDFIDGMYQHPDNDTNEMQSSLPIITIKKKTKKNIMKASIPNCSGHLQPCKLCTVKKSGPNQGRKFYVCSTSSRMDQCTTFIWVDDTTKAAQDALYKNRSVSGFIARRVAAYMEQMNSYTVPELKQLAQRYRLDPSGTKAQLRMRLSVWVRDEIANGCTDMGLVDEESPSPLHSVVTDTDHQPLEGGDSSFRESTSRETDSVADADDDASEEASDDDSTTSSSDDELELIGEDSNSKFSFRSSGLADKKKEGDAATVNLSCIESEDDEKGQANENSTSASVYSTLKKLFGYTEFRDGQEWAIHRCLNHQRSLLVAPTGFGKSLCYTLPAAMMDGVCIVVSPLLSLIHDQIRMLPARLAAATLSGSMSTANVAATLDDIVRGRIKLLFVSPERLTSNSFRRLFRPTWNATNRKYERYFPEVSLFCVDEAHCMSQWAHNFRPSYLRLQSIIELIDPRSILAMTATAGPKVVDDICRTLRIENAADTSISGVSVSKTNRDNIDVKCLFLNTQEERISKLLQILTASDKHGTQMAEHTSLDGCLSTGSVIVYTWRQQDAEAVAENIQAADVKGGVVVYHGGMDAVSRTKAQSKFMRGKARICVATIAFGLGINKADVAGIVHLYLSSSPEHYIQEIGRAGRDGRPAQAISLILNDEILIRHSLAYSDLISKSQVKALINMVRQQVVESLLPIAEKRAEHIPVNIAVQLSMSVVLYDCKVETAETILSLLEQRNGKEPLLFIQGISYDRATIAPKRCLLEKLAVNEPVLQAIMKCADHVEPPAGQLSTAEEPDGYFPVRRSALSNNVYGSYTFSVTKSSNCLGDMGEPRHVFAALRRLETNGEIDFTLEASPKDRVLSLRLTSEGMKYFKENNDDDIDMLVEETTGRFISTITSCSDKVIEIHRIMRKVYEVDPINGDGTKSASLTQFQHLIERYFEAEGAGNLLAVEPSDLPYFNNDFSGRELAADIENVLSQLHNIHAGFPAIPGKLQLADASVADYTVLTITKFLHGLAPASIPLNLIRQHHLFGKMQGVQFNKLHDAVARIFSYSQ